MKKRRIRFDRIYMVLFTLFMIYFTASFLDTVSHNTLGSAYGLYHSWNLFNILK
jgi:hypothetical protein